MSQPDDIQVLWCDPALLVINKHAGLRTLPDGYNPTLPHVKKLLEQEFGRLWIVHRLDRETSGVLLLARTAEAHRSLNTQFEQHLVSKIYHALVIGNPDWQEKTISLPLRPNGDRHHRTVIDLDQGKPAVTRLKVMERFDHYCLIEAIPETGRTHQIRTHLSSLGLYIAGDKLYGARKNDFYTDVGLLLQRDLALDEKSIGGIGLHAFSLEINHPTHGERLKFEAAYPEALAYILEQLRELGKQK
jgi:RluA family pseudouridine synthase